MRKFEKSSKLDNVLYDVRGPVVDEANRMVEDGMEVLKLNIGNPYPFGFSAPQEVILDMLSNIRTSQGYSDSKGIFSARKAIMQYSQLKHIPNVTMSDIYTGNGVSELIIFSDEIYDRLVMDGYEHTSIASLAPDVFCVTFSGLSKSHMIAGFRIGWMILSGAKDKAKGYIEGLNMLSSMRLCSNVPAQSIVQTALGGYQSVNEYIQPGGRIYEQREYVYKALTDIPGITAVKPKAAFYIFPKIDTEKFNITNDEQFALDFLHEKQVLLVPGKGFNWGQPDHFRVVYLPNVLQLEKAIGKLKDFLAAYKQK